MFLLSIIFDTSGFYGSYKEMRSSLSRRKTEGNKYFNLNQRTKLSKNMQFVADADIYLAKKGYNSDSF